MNVDVILEDLDHIIEAAPRVERTEWARQAIRRLEAARLIIAHQAALLADATPRKVDA